MAKYTTTIYRLKLNHFDFGLQAYPIFDESYRETLNEKILNHYLMDEIGLETAALFKHYLNTRMAEIMPKYNIMYKALLKTEENWDNNVDLSKTVTRTETKNDTKETRGESTRDNTLTSNGNGRGLGQDTPQGSVKAAKTIEEAQYATNFQMSESNTTDTTHETGNGTTTETGTGDRTEEYVEKLMGNNGKKYGIELYDYLTRGIMNIDSLIINDLQSLFMGVY